MRQEEEEGEGGRERQEEEGEARVRERQQESVYPWEGLGGSEGRREGREVCWW